MKARCLRFYYVCAYYASWGWFAAIGLLLNLLCLPLRLLPHGEGSAIRTRAVIRWLFSWWVRWFAISGCLKISWRGFEKPLPSGTIYIANHPTLLDATFLLAKIPNAICILKPKLMANPAIGSAAKLADYVSAHGGVDLILSMVQKMGGGSSTLIFPEGTRTAAGCVLGPLKPGFALIAQRTGAPVRLCVIRASEGLVPRGRPWWSPPPILPATIEISLDRVWLHDEERGCAQFMAEVEARILEQLGQRAS